jgi:hypothetical protein
MKALHIIQKIYTQPLDAFDHDELDESFKEALGFWMGLAIVSSPIWYLAAQRVTPGWEGFRIMVIGMLVGYGNIILTACIVQWMVRHEGAALGLRPFGAGVIWILVALMPISYLTGFLGQRWPYWFQSGITIGLIGLCVHSLSGLSIKKSLIIIILSYVLAVFISGLFVGVIFFLIGNVIHH